jgi:FixJ family two-component response regulator
MVVMVLKRSQVQRAFVSVVDDDESVRNSLPRLLKELGFEGRAFSSGNEFLSSDCVNSTRCLILDVAMPDMNGFDVQRELRLRGQKFPIIFITASEDEAVRVKAFDQGAAGFLLKPFSDTALLSAIEAALLDRT